MRSPLRLLLVLALLVLSAVACLGVGTVVLAAGAGDLGLGGLPVSALPGAGAAAGAAPGGPGSTGPGVIGAGAGAGAGVPSPAALGAVAWALARLGTPYRWGGEGDGGFDCSGLVQAAFAAAGVRLPRVAQDQYDAGPHLAPSTPVRAGDLVFFGSSPADVDHVGIVVARGQMVDAPHTGAVVRVEPIWSAGYVGATRPAP